MLCSRHHDNNNRLVESQPAPIEPKAQAKKTATMATNWVSDQESRLASCQIFRANKTVKDNRPRFDRASNGSPEMLPNSNRQQTLKAREIQIAVASTMHHVAWSRRPTVVSMTISRTTYWLHVILYRGIAAALHIGEDGPFQVDCTFISCRVKKRR